MTKVDITTAGHTIIVESDEPLDTVAAKALDLWRQTRDPKLDRGFGVAGCLTERAGVDFTAETAPDLTH